jgi:N-methylhydantoinase A
LHACALAEALHIPHVIVPAFPGALSALGILASDVVKDYSRTVLWRVSGKVPHAQLAREFSALEKNAVSDFRQESWQGKPQFRRSVDVRYRGQGYELNIALSADLLKDFEREHQRRYSYTHPNREIEFVTLRLRAWLKSETTRVPADAFVRSKRVAAREPALDKPVFFDGRKLKSRLYAREELEPGKKYPGPAIITEYSATTVVPPGSRFHVDKAANLIVSQ